MRRSAQNSNKEVPQWTTRFRCRVIKADLDLAILRKIAGRQQAKDKTVQSMSFGQTMEWFWEYAQVGIPSLADLL